MAPHEQVEPDFADWAARVAAGAAEAEARVTEFFLPRVRALLRARLRDPDLAGDLSQEVLMAVLVALRRGHVRDGARLPAFVAGVARNQANNHLRGVRRRAETAIDDRVAEIEAADAASAHDREDAVARGLAAVAAGDREVLILTLVDGLQPREIARRLAVSPEAVRQRKARALKRIVAALSPPGPGTL